MNKAVVYTGIGLGVAVLAFLVYKFIVKAPGQGAQNPYSNPANQVAGYPFQAAVDPRMDNSNQPWFGNNRAAITQQPKVQVGGGGTLGSMAGDLGSVASIIKSGKSIWEELGVSDWFSSGDVSLDDYNYDTSNWW